MSEGFEPGADDEYHEIFKNFKNKELITKTHRSFFKESFDEPHLKRLVKKSRLSFGSKDRAKCSAVIRKMFHKLNEIDEVIPILKICSLSEKLQIVFDFNCDSVVDMDPTQGSTEVGVTLPDSGFIYVGAKNQENEFFEVIGILIHELTHYAMKLVYDNDCKPYVDDIEDKRNFETITKETKKICDENPSTDRIVTRVFDNYGPERWHSELIVRVPQLFAHYKKNPKALEAAERNTPELFKFYRGETFADLERKVKTRLHKYSIRKINNQTGIAQKIKKLDIKFERVENTLKLKTMDWKSEIIITSNVPQLTLAMLNQFDCDDSHIFVSLEQVATGNILDKITKVNAKESSTALIVDCIGQAQKYPESLRKLLEGIENIKKIALVMTETESSKVKENFPEVESKTFDHKWAELTERSKVHLLDQNVIFQGVETKLNKLVEPSSEAMNFFPLSELLDCKASKIGNELHETSHKFHIPRKFIKKGQANPKSFEELLRDESKMGSMIISDEAGSGKSVTLCEVAKSLHKLHTDRWVLFVDLKRHIKSFKGVENCEKIESFEDFIVQSILKDEPEFDRELFKQMFRAGKTFVLLDGFDEISPNYKILLLHVLKLFKPRSGNQLFITTRPHLEEDLEGALGKFVFKLEEFSEESQKSFLRKYWRSVGLEIGEEDFEDLSNRLLEKFSRIAFSKIVGLPLLLRMTAEIFEDPIRENFLHKFDSLSIASLFREFVEKYLARWTNTENEISLRENVEFQMAGGVLEVHHNIAIKHKFEEFVKFEVGESEAEKIARVGLVRYDKTEKTFQFIHQTFEEYFLADFIWFHLSRKNKNPSHDCRMAIEVLVEVVWSYDCEIIETFLGPILKAMNFSPTGAFCKSVARCLSEILRSKNRFNILNDILRAQEQEHLACLLLSIAKHVEKDVLAKLLRLRKPGGGSALLSAAEYGSKATVSTLCDIITKCTDNPKEIFQIESVLGNVLTTAAGNRNVGVLKTLCENFYSVLTNDEIKIMFQQKDDNGQNIVQAANYTVNYEVFLELISLLPKYLSPDEIKSLLRAVDDDNQNFFHRALTRDENESLKKKFEVVKSNFEIEDQKIFFFKPENAPNMFHYAAQNQNEKIFETIIYATRDLLSSDEIKSMLKGKDSKGSNVLHIIAEHGNEVVLNELNLLLRQPGRERLSEDEIRKLLLEVNEKEQNCFRLAANNIQLGLQVFCRTIGRFLSTDEQTRLLQESINGIDIISLACGNYGTMEILPVKTIKELLSKEDEWGRNAFEKVAFGGDVDTWNKLISFAQARFSVDEMKIFLFCIDDNRLNCLHQAVTNWENRNMIEAICQTIKNVGLTVEEQKKFVRQKDSLNRNIFHHVASSFDTFKYFSLYNGLSAMLSNDEIKEMLKAKDSYGDNFLCTHSKLCHIAESRDLKAFLQENLTNDEIKELFFDVNREGQNFFHCAVKYATKFKIKSLSENLKRDEQKKLFDIKSPNVFQMAVESFDPKIFSTLHECLKEVLTEDEIKSLIQEKDSENKNVLHLICQYRSLYDDDESFNEARLRDFLKVLKVVFDADEIKNFLTSSNDNVCFSQRSLYTNFFSKYCSASSEPSSTKMISEI